MTANNEPQFEASPFTPDPARLNHQGRRALNREALASDFAGLSAGAIGFFLSIPASVLRPTNVDWLMGDDPASAYLGWEFFRRDEWRLPLGKNPTFGLENASSIVYSDSLPLFAIPAKVITAHTAAPFQYFGVWLFLCLLLQGLFSARLIGRFNLSTSSTFLGSLLACLLPFHLCRLSYGYGHFALFGHFVILAGLILVTKRQTIPLKRWALLLVVCLAIHAYLFLMIAFLAAAQLVAMRRVPLRSRILSIFLISPVVLASSWIFGYFELPFSATKIGVGGFKADITSLVRSLARGGISWSNLYSSDVLIGDGEGFAFLGLGALGLVALSAVIRSTNRFEQRLARKGRSAVQNPSSAAFPGFVYVAVSLLAILSLRPVITLGRTELNVPLPNIFADALDPFRANGRFLWPLAYVLFFASMAIFSTRRRRLVVLIFSGALLLQLFDTSAARSIGYEMISDGYNYFPSRREWLTTALQTAGGPICSVRVANLRDLEQSELWIDLADFALENSLATNFVYLARTQRLEADTSESSWRISVLQNPFALHILSVQALAELETKPLHSGWRIDVRDRLVLLIPKSTSVQNESEESRTAGLLPEQCSSATFRGNESD